MSPSSNASARILVIDDDPAIGELFRELLGDAGYAVALEQRADDAGPVLAAIAAAAPDLVILDLFTVDTAARWDLLEKIRANPALRDVPIVVCSGAIQQLMERAEALERLRVTVVPKPFDIDHLLAVIAELVGEDAGAAEPDTARH